MAGDKVNLCPFSATPSQFHLLAKEMPSYTAAEYRQQSFKYFMHADLAIKMMSDLLWTGLILCLPILGLTMLVGLMISIIQVVTQVQEMSLTFVPKLLMAGASLLMFGPWMLRTLGQFATQLWTNIPKMF